MGEDRPGRRHREAEVREVLGAWPASISRSSASARSFEHALTRTVTETDNVLFSALTHNPQPLHLDAEFAKPTEFGQRLVNSIFTLGLMIGISVGDTTLGHDGRQSRHDRRALPEAGLPRRHAAFGNPRP